MAYARVMHHYHLPHREIMRLPIRTFWFLNSAVGRIQAELNLRMLQVFASSQSNEGYEEIRKALINEQGFLMKEAPTLDLDGLNQLRSM